MKCQRQPEFLKGKPTPIEDLWEVKLPQATWQKICAVADAREVHYTAITRYCIFKLCEQAKLRITQECLQKMKKLKKEANSDMKAHRHIVCFYGEDVKLVRLMALQLGVTVSALIRLALDLYLADLAFATKNHSSSVPDPIFLRYSIKRWYCIQFSELNTDNIPAIHQFTYSMFLPWHYWGCLARLLIPHTAN